MIREAMPEQYDGDNSHILMGIDGKISQVCNRLEKYRRMLMQFGDEDPGIVELDDLVTEILNMLITRKVVAKPTEPDDWNVQGVRDNDWMVRPGI